jgi:Ca2+-binding EF-hand superfamily protein
MYKLKHSKLVREIKPHEDESLIHHRHTDRFPTPPHKDPRWKKIRTPPIRSPQFRRIRQSPLANVKGHFDHLRNQSRERNFQKQTKHRPFIPLLPKGNVTPVSRPSSTHSFDSVSSMEDFIYHQKRKYVETPPTPRYARDPEQAKKLDKRRDSFLEASHYDPNNTPNSSARSTPRYVYTPSKKKFVDDAPHLVPLPWERSYKYNGPAQLTEAQQKIIDAELEASTKIISHRDFQHRPLQVVKQLRQKMTGKDNGATKIIRVFKNFDIGAAGEKAGKDAVRSGGNDNLLDINEVREGLNNLLNLNLTSNETEKVMQLVDRNGDGQLSIEEFLYAAKSDEIADMITKSDMSRYRSTIDQSKRKKALERRLRHGIKHKDEYPKAGPETSFYRRRRKAQATKQFRDAYHAPYKVLKRLREGITMKNIIKTFKLMDVGNSGVGPYQSQYEKEAEKIEKQEELRVKLGDDARHHSLDHTVGYNDLLDPSEIKKGINKFLNFNLDDKEVKALMDVIDKNGDGQLSFGELFEAIAGPEVETYIEDHLRTAKRFLLPDDHLKAYKITGKITARKDDDHRADAHPLEELSILDEHRLKPSKIALMADRDIHPRPKEDVSWIADDGVSPGYMDVHHTKRKRKENTLYVPYDPKIHTEKPPKLWHQRADEVTGWNVPIKHDDIENLMKIAKQTDCINYNGVGKISHTSRRPAQKHKPSQLDFTFSKSGYGKKLNYARPPRGTSPCIW